MTKVNIGKYEFGKVVMSTLDDPSKDFGHIKGFSKTPFDELRVIVEWAAEMTTNEYPEDLKVL